MSQASGNIDIAATVAAHDAQIGALASNLQATNANVDKLAAAVDHGFKAVDAQIQRTSLAIQQKVDLISAARAEDRSWNWQNISAIFGIIAILIGAAMYTMQQAINAAASHAEAARQLDKAVFETHLSYYQRDFAKATNVIDNLVQLATTQTQQIAGVNKDSEWRSDLNAEKLDRLNSEVARIYRMQTGNDLPFISTHERGPKPSSDVRDTRIGQP